MTVEQARPSRPENVPDEMWALVERCGDHDPHARPTFSEITEDLAKLV